jgi:hypothetical protein
MNGSFFVKGLLRFSVCVWLGLLRLNLFVSARSFCCRIFCQSCTSLLLSSVSGSISKTVSAFIFVNEDDKLNTVYSTLNRIGYQICTANINLYQISAEHKN